MNLGNANSGHLASVIMMAALSLGCVVAGGTVGCASILGIETGDEVASDTGDDGKIADPETEISTTEQCVQYCDAVMTNCTGDNAQYTARASCINTCNNLPPGSVQDAEPSSNTVLCRIKQAELAEEFASDTCAAAGPGGNEECGNNCESWCHLLSQSCTKDFNEMDDCEASCATIPGGEFFDLSGYDDNKDDIQCRIAHLGAAGSGLEADQVHCEHARFSPVGNCVGETAELSCEGYCQAVMGACLGDLAVYKDSTECEASCPAFELGEAGDESGNTIACRSYHSGAALSLPETHCAHAGPAGDGHCGKDAADGSTTGNCESYCRVYSAGCSEEFAAEFSDVQATCVSQCAGSGLLGVEVGSGYTYATAPDSDGVACRIRRSIEARAGGDAAPEHDALCAKAALDGQCD
jgi:hypothetical protein